jgi:hypothetical protein
MKTIGKILLFIGGLLFFVAAILGIISLVQTCVKAPATYFGTDPFYSGILAFALVILWLLLDLMGGYSGMVYALVGRKRGWVKVLCVVIIVLLILGIIDAITHEMKTQTFAWSDWSGLVYGGVAGIIYLFGYLLDHKRA